VRSARLSLTQLPTLSRIAELSAGADSFSWDWSNRRESATASGTTVGYAYVGDNVRVGVTVGGSSSPYLWDREAGLPLLVDDGTSAYLHDQFGVLAEIDGAGSAYHLADALGSVRGLTDATGTVTGTAEYSVFGAVRGQSGGSSHFGFTGEWTDATTGFTHLRARDLNPALGRFLSVDTVQPNAPGTQGYNQYAYVANNPTTWVDPTGHQAANPAAPILRPMPEVRAIARLLAYMALARAGVATVATTCVAYIVICSLALLAVAIVIVLFVVICVLEVGGPCWTTQTLDRDAPPQVRDFPDTLPRAVPRTGPRIDSIARPNRSSLILTMTMKTDVEKPLKRQRSTIFLWSPRDSLSTFGTIMVRRRSGKQLIVRVTSRTRHGEGLVRYSKMRSGRRITWGPTQIQMKTQIALRHFMQENILA
jgi:RHS repeat-associated protein